MKKIVILLESKGVILRCGGSQRNAKEWVDCAPRPVVAAAAACGSKQKW